MLQAQRTLLASGEPQPAHAHRGAGISHGLSFPEASRLTFGARNGAARTAITVDAPPNAIVTSARAGDAISVPAIARAALALKKGQWSAVASQVEARSLQGGVQALEWMAVGPASEGACTAPWP